MILHWLLFLTYEYALIHTKSSVKKERTQRENVDVCSSCTTTERVEYIDESSRQLTRMSHSNQTHSENQ